MIRIDIRKKLHMAGGNGELVVNTDLAQGSFTAVFGPSGAGKTSLLRILAGLMQPEEGYIEVNGEVWLDTVRKVNLPPQKRNVGFLFQDYALFPNMTVRENLLYALPDAGDKLQVNSLLLTLNMQALADKRPELLSGGQKQRVALARALLRRPQLLLLDEPLSALDHSTRIALQDELKIVHHKYGVTTLLVSHDVPEVYKLAENVISLDAGTIQQVGSPAQVFGLQQYTNGLIVIGEVIAVNNGIIQVLTGHAVIQLSETEQTAGLSIGTRVSIHAADLSLQKLL
ncbi:ATP-binding cassette domain-containing protein [Mucilaginibacter sp. PAMB04274]|uniref:ATP-binding cassette domain-containing protein n=1 Tax=Mucilaginibacter sp. PAMB04274 TaxID=3138568 RepID=UPI0031F612B2